ncbi:TPA: hypothetical protein ACHBXM_000288 [Klebsiella aerogenes]
MLNERNWGKLLYFIDLWIFSSSAVAGLPNFSSEYLRASPCVATRKLFTINSYGVAKQIPPLPFSPLPADDELNEPTDAFAMQKSLN